MKTKVTNDLLKELSEDEYVSINGGESAWYWISYGAGVVAREAQELAIDVFVAVQSNRSYTRAL